MNKIFIILILGLLFLSGCGSGSGPINQPPLAASQDQYRPNYVGDLTGIYRFQGTEITYAIKDRDCTSIRSVPIPCVAPTERQKEDIHSAMRKWAEPISEWVTLREAQPGEMPNIDFVVQDESDFQPDSDETDERVTKIGRSDSWFLFGKEGRYIGRSVVRLRSDLPERTFRFTALHEAGHSLGLRGHSRGVLDVMAAATSEYSLSLREIELSQRDKNTISASYSSE